MEEIGISRKLFNLKDSEEGYADFEIHCGSQIHKVHEAVISAASPFFKAACGGPFREGQQGVVRLPKDNPDAVTAMIRFIYLNDYTSDLDHDEQCKLECSSASDCASHLSLHAHLYGLGEKYDIPYLKDVSMGFFHATLKLHTEELTVSSFHRAAKIVYSTTPEGDIGMRSILLDAISQRSDLLTKRSFEQLLQATPDMARQCMQI